MAEAQAADVSAMDKVRQAALARAQAPAENTVQLHGEVKEAVKAFNAAVHQVPDYMHIHCAQIILDALQILDKVLKDLITHGGKSPKDPSKQMSIKTKAFRKKSHELDSAYKAVVLLGFKEEVADLEKSLVYHGRFPDAARAKEYLGLCSERLETTLRDVQRHAKASGNSKEKKQTIEQRQRAAAMAQYEEDRARQKERAAREKRLRGDTVAATPIAERSRDRTVTRPQPPGMGMRGKMPLMGAPDGTMPAAAAPTEAPAPHSNSGEEEDEEEEEDGDMQEDDEDEGMPGEFASAGVRRRFPGQGNRLGGE